MTALGYERPQKSQAPPERPWHDTGGISSSALATLLNPESLALAARVQQARRSLVKDKAYRATMVGGEVGRFLRSLKWSDSPQNTLDTYEIPLARLAYDHAHFVSMEEFTTEVLRDFLEHHWGDAASTTRRNRLAAVRSFFEYEVEERGLPFNPAARIKPPKKPRPQRQAYPQWQLQDMWESQPTLRDRICVQLLARHGLRKNELRLLQVWDFDLTAATFKVQGKGDNVSVLPVAFPEMQAELELHLIGRDGAEYLLYPKADPLRPMNQASVHRWFKRCLERAGLPAKWKTHEMRHSAADHLWRETGDLVAAQQLLRHSSPVTTGGYLHPSLDDLTAALLRSSNRDSA